MSATDPLALRVAAFVIQALELDFAAEELASEVVAIKRDPHAGISALELESDIGVAGFLVYSYGLDERGSDGVTGQEQFDLDLRTLERAATHRTPGPRLLAQGQIEQEGFILATSPAVFDALIGNEGASSLEATGADLLPTAEVLKMRQESAATLLRLLSEAEQEAKRWVEAVSALTNQGATSETSVEERALTLMILDEQGIPNLLQLISSMVQAAQDSVADLTMKRPANGKSGKRR